MIRALGVGSSTATHRPLAAPPYSQQRSQRLYYLPLLMTRLFSPSRPLLCLLLMLAHTHPLSLLPFLIPLPPLRLFLLAALSRHARLPRHPHNPVPLLLSLPLPLLLRTALHHSCLRQPQHSHALKHRPLRLQGLNQRRLRPLLSPPPLRQSDRQCLRAPILRHSWRHTLHRSLTLSTYKSLLSLSLRRGPILLLTVQARSHSHRSQLFLPLLSLRTHFSICSGKASNAARPRLKDLQGHHRSSRRAIQCLTPLMECRRHTCR